MTLMEVEARMGNHERLMQLRLQQVPAGGAVVVALIAWAAPAVPKWFPGVRILRVVRSALVLQVALILAVVNGVRRRWDVWRDPLRPMFEDVRQS